MNECNVKKAKKWTVYPQGDLDTVIIIYYYNNKWKVIPFSVFNNNCVIHDDKSSIVLCKITNTIMAVPAILKFKKIKNNRYFFEDNKGNEYDPIKATMNNNRINILEVYKCTLEDVLTTFKDPIYLKHNYSNENSNLCYNYFDYGILYTGKTVSKDGIQKKKQIIVTSTFKSFLKWIKNFNSAIIEKDSIIIPTTKKHWLKIYPESKVVNSQVLQ